LWILYRYRWLAATCFGVVVAVTCLYTLLTPRVYTPAPRARVTRDSPIQLQLEENVLRGDDTDRLVNGSSSFLATQVQALRSRDLAERVIRQHELATSDALLHPQGRAAGAGRGRWRAALPAAAARHGRPRRADPGGRHVQHRRRAGDAARALHQMADGGGRPRHRPT